MAPEGPDTHAAIVLVRDSTEAVELDRLLRELCVPDAADGLSILTPKVRGLDFFADDACAEELDDWWASSVPPEALPVYFLHHEAGLSSWVGGLDGHFYVTLSEAADAQHYDAFTNVTSLVAEDGRLGATLAFGEALLRDVDAGVITVRVQLPASGARGSDELFRPTKTRRMQRSRARFRRARLDSDELAPPAGESYADDQAAEGEDPTDEIIGILSTTLNRLQRLRSEA